VQAFQDALHNSPDETFSDTMRQRLQRLTTERDKPGAPATGRAGAPGL
jgi:hypothetical protein